MSTEPLVVVTGEDPPKYTTLREVGLYTRDEDGELVPYDPGSGVPVTAATVTVAAYPAGSIAAGTLQDALQALATRVTQLEAAATP